MLGGSEHKVTSHTNTVHQAQTTSDFICTKVDEEIGRGREACIYNIIIIIIVF